MELSESLVTKCLNVIDAGLVCGLGKPEPGKMCVEAAINYALGRPHGDDPGCVAASVRALKIKLNDSLWSSPAARARGMRRLAIMQLGTKGTLDDVEFAIRVALIVYTEPSFVRWAHAWLDGSDRSSESAARAEAAARVAAARVAAWAAARAAAWSAWSAAWAEAQTAARAADAAAEAAEAAEAGDKPLADFAEAVVQVLVTMNAPATKYLSLTEVA